MNSVKAHLLNNKAMFVFRKIFHLKTLVLINGLEISLKKK